MIRMDEFNKIRKAFFNEGLSVNEIAHKFNRAWDTINTIVHVSRDDIDDRGKREVKEPKVATQEVVNAILAYFEEEKRLRVKKKQRYTAKKIFDDLKLKGVYNGSERTLQALVKKLRREHAESKQEKAIFH